MKRATLVAAALCCLLVSAQANAQDVYTTSFLQVFDEVPPVRMLGVAITDMGYGTMAYYDMRIAVSLARTDGTFGFDYQVYSCTMCTRLEGSTSLDYDPAAEYETQFQPSVQPYFRNEDGAFVDHYYYGYYLDGVPVLWPGSAGAYGFTGPGPEITTSIADIVLGTLTAFFSGGSQHGIPDHVKVISDDTQYNAGCDYKERFIHFRVVDSRGRRVGAVSVDEQFLDKQNGLEHPFVWNSCQQKNVRPTSCTAIRDGTFTDRLSTGCPNVQGDCGYSPVLSRWRWCPRDRTPVTLTTNTYDVRRNSILVNGGTKLNDGTELR